MNKQAARAAFDEHCERIFLMAIGEDAQGSLQDQVDAMMAEADPSEVVMYLEIVLRAEITKEDINLHEDRQVAVTEGSKGIRELCAFLYGYGARRYLMLSPSADGGVEMGADMRA